MISNATGLGIAIRGRYTTGGIPTNQHLNSMLVMDSVSMIPPASGATRWTTALQLDSVFNGVVNNCIFNGTGFFSNAGISIVKNSVNLSVSNTGINFFETGIKCLVYDEGLAISNTIMVPVVYGVVFKSDNSTAAGRSTYFTMTGSHIDAKTTQGIAVDVEFCSAVCLSGNVFIAGDDPASPVAVVKFARVFESTITGCQIYGNANKGIWLLGVTVGATTFPSQGVSIVGCNFRGQPNNIYAEAASRQILTADNTATDNVTSPSSFFNLINTDAGVDNFIGESIGITGVLTIPAGNPTTANFNVDISKAGLGKKPDGIAVDITSDTSVCAQYDWDSGSSTKTNAVIRLFKYDGTALTTGGVYRYSLRVGP
jgi:hypothetical protein